MLKRVFPGGGVDVGEIRRLLKAEPTRIQLNRARRSVQVFGCTGEAIANIPMNEFNWATLSE